ncbi:MAG: MGMT family protein [Oceanococcaceae bacterium]
MPAEPALSSAQRIQAVARSIPAGRVAAYGQVADLAGLPGRARMVGRALGEDDERHSLPWHRVLCADGRIAFPPDSPHFSLQRERLLAEGVIVSGGRVDMRRYRWQPSLAELAFGLDF